MKYAKPKKRFSQNFLVDEAIIANIIKALHISPDDVIMEVGPGRGALTHPLSKIANTLHAMEIDKALVEKLKQQFQKKNHVFIHQGDALKLQLSQFQIAHQPFRVVGNLPYHITTPLIFHFLATKKLIKDMHFMVQKEVAERLTASPNTKNFGRLTVMAQFACDVAYLFTVPAQAFFPVPKVDSAVIRLTPHHQYQGVDFATLDTLVKTAFNQRRKTLRNALKAIVPLETFETLGLDPNARAENLRVEDYVALANYTLSP